MKKSGKSRKKRIFRKIMVFLIVMLLIAGGVWYAYNSLKMEYTVTYDTYYATTGSISNSLSFSGNFSLVDSAAYAASSSSTVRTIYVSAGEEVKENEKLIRLANGETITADFDGRVNTLSVAEGDSVSPGSSLVQIADFTHLKVSFRIDEYDIGNVKIGQPCTVTVTSLERQFTTEVAEIDYISASSGNVAYYTATAYVDVDEGVLPGMQVTVSIPQEEAQNVVILKVDALSFDFTNQAYVWMKDSSGELEQVFVTTGVSNGNYIEITDGLMDGDEVFVEVETAAPGTASLLGGLFGGRQFNQSMGGMPSGNFPNGGNFNRENAGSFMNGGNFNQGNAGSFNGNGGGNSSGFGGGNPSGFGGGRPNNGGGN